ncbi:hypothetical protein [Streptomyces mutomycini]|uniref:hypothetical protein n=1 Tax=Streptomyces mutomycini TaxID=284036 RepID=UPI0033C4F394
MAAAVEEEGSAEVGLCFESPLPDGSGWMSGGGSGMGNIGWFARLDADRSLLWVAAMWVSNPFVGVRYEGARAVFVNDWGNLLTLRPAELASCAPLRPPRRDGRPEAR